MKMEEVIKALNCFSASSDDYPDCPCSFRDAENSCERNVARKAQELLKEQEAILNELLDLGYPHNFQHEATWVVDYLYSLTEIIKKVFKAKEGR